jgi:phosphate/phosphite/phosphonate ABC transporter binding protein
MAKNLPPDVEEDGSIVGNPALEQTDVLPPTPMVGGKYKLGRLIGEGGMGAVYEAEHTGLGVRVAVKLLNEMFTTDPAALARFRREARAAAAIRHGNIVEVTDTGTDDEGVPFIVMELLEGESLSSLLRRERVLPAPTAVAVASQILAGLAAAHDKNVIHRDLKPGNIILARTPDGATQVKILDFGISKFNVGNTSADVTATGAVVGTPRFMAPEQAKGQPDLDGRVDIYAVGVLLYRMVTGRLPFAAKTQDEIIQLILEGRPAPPRQLRPELSPELEKVILRAMAQEREDRYPDARVFFAELMQAMPDITVGGTMQITSINTLTGPTPLSLSGPLSLPLTGRSLQGDSVVDQSTRPASPHALRQERRPILRHLLLATVVVAALGGTAGWYLWARHRTVTPPRAGTAAGAGGPTIRFGITRYLPEGLLKSEHSNLVRYLSERLQRPVEIQVLEDYVDLSAQLAAGKLEMAALSSYAYVRAKRQWPGLQLIATHVTAAGTTYEGHIVARVDSGVETLQDLQGKVFCYIGPNSSSGYLYPRAVFRKHGMDPDKSFKATRFTGDHLAALRAVESGACDAAAVFAGIFFEGEKHNISAQKYTILATTPRIPYDAYCVPPNLPVALRTALRDALLALVPGSDLARRYLGEHSRITGFGTVEDRAYDSVRRIEKYLDTSALEPKKRPR